MPEDAFQPESFTRRARLSAREIAIALALTLAAVAFVVAALSSGLSETAAVIGPGGTSEGEPN